MASLAAVRHSRISSTLFSLRNALSGSSSSSSLSSPSSEPFNQRIPHISLAGRNSTAAADPLSSIREEIDQELEERKRSASFVASLCKLVFLGGPGVGKGTWASLLSKKLNVPHISTGDLVRKELSKSSSSCSTTRDLLLLQKVKETMNQGKLLPDEIVLELLKRRLQQTDPSQGFILDGFPRTIMQARILDDAVDGVDMAINFHLNDDVLVAKCLGRRMCSHCGNDYNLAHVVTKPGKQERIFLPARLPPPECASKLRVRGDDSSEAVVLERIRVYAQESAPLEQHYRSQGRFVELDVGPGADYVWPRLVDAVYKLEHTEIYNAARC